MYFLTRNKNFYPRNAMLARVLAMACLLSIVCLSASVCLSVCLSVTSRSSIETNGRIGLVFDRGASFVRPILRCYTKIRVPSKIRVLQSGTPELRQGISIVKACYQLRSAKVDVQSVINWTVVGQLS